MERANTFTFLGHAAAMNEHAKARAWRLARNLSVDELAELIGYARETIYAMERGEMHRKAIAPWVFQRYKLACAGLDAEFRTGREFVW
jgi:transcriptional regulator with XRE-family HTH domain